MSLWLIWFTKLRSQDEVKQGQAVLAHAEIEHKIHEDMQLSEALIGGGFYQSHDHNRAHVEGFIRRLLPYQSV